MLTDRMIASEATSDEEFRKGHGYFISGRVKKLSWEKAANIFRAEVQGSRLYYTEVELLENNEIYHYDCQCVEFDKYDAACKHIVATLKAIQSAWSQTLAMKSGIPFDRSTKALLETFKSTNFGKTENTASHIQDSSENVKIVPKYFFSSINGRKMSWLNFNVGKDKLYLMKDVKSFVEAISTGRGISYGKNFEFKPNISRFDEKSLALLELLKESNVDEKSINDSYNYYYDKPSVFHGRKYNLTNSKLRQFFEIMKMKDEEFEITINEVKYQNSKIIEGRPDFKLAIKSLDGGIKIALELEKDRYYGLDARFNHVYHKGFIYKVDSQFASLAEPLINCFNEHAKPELIIPEAEVHSLFSSVLPKLEKIASVKVEASLTKNYYNEELEKQIYFDKFGEGISAKIVFKYGVQLINPLDKVSSENVVVEGKMLLRKTEEENNLVEIINKHLFQPLNDIYVQKKEEDTYKFLNEGLNEIRDLAEIFYSEEFKNINIKRNGKVSAGVRINQNDLLEMNIQYEDMDFKELMEMLASYKQKKKYHRLKTGQFIPLDSTEFLTAAEIIDQLNLNQNDLSKNVIELPKYRAMYIDSLTREKTGVHLDRSSAFKKMVKDISEPQDMEFELPQGILGTLRDYQKTGFKWLKTLAYYGFGGILADDMGLGKTLQVIAFVKAEKAEKAHKRRPCLVIAPTSLVYNWQEEVKKFAPDLDVTVLSGQQAERRERFSEIPGSDIVVTSYGMIKRDIKLYQDFQFEYCFIDEAQHIKNPNTLNAKAVKQIRAKAYFALTGTPIENTLTELWSIFDFIMPGYLLSHNRFTTKFETPIVKNGNREVLTELGRHIKPFIMRRMKKDVLLELPEKIESKMTNEMTEEQKKVYAGYLMKAKKEFEDEMSTAGFDNSRIKILALLTRLRQVCCHPSLFIENYFGGSGKLEMLMELLEDAIDGGHRILVFSQFTSMLSLIKIELEKTKIKYQYLDGATRAEERMRLVNAFNDGENDIFLISLKAGGTGLNLTGADMVVHFDPWWNPAVEDQATDRAYRIGQKNAVQVFKLITKDTIEEKIFALQQKKRELIDSVIKPGENFITKMTEKEIRGLFEIG